MSKEKSQPVIAMVQLLSPMRFGEQGVPLENLYVMDSPVDTKVDNGLITISWDADPRFIRIRAVRTGRTQLIPMNNIGSITIKE